MISMDGGNWGWATIVMFVKRIWRGIKSHKKNTNILDGVWLSSVVVRVHRNNICCGPTNVYRFMIIMANWLIIRSRSFALLTATGSPAVDWNCYWPTTTTTTTHTHTHKGIECDALVIENSVEVSLKGLHSGKFNSFICKCSLLGNIHMHTAIISLFGPLSRSP